MAHTTAVRHVCGIYIGCELRDLSMSRHQSIARHAQRDTFNFETSWCTSPATSNTLLGSLQAGNASNHSWFPFISMWMSETQYTEHSSGNEATLAQRGGRAQTTRRLNSASKKLRVALLSEKRQVGALMGGNANLGEPRSPKDHTYITRRARSNLFFLFWHTWSEMSSLATAQIRNCNVRHTPCCVG